jgi:hypothetical protein
MIVLSGGLFFGPQGFSAAFFWLIEKAKKTKRRKIAAVQKPDRLLD